jgi:hypothetical protein
MAWIRPQNDKLAVANAGRDLVKALSHQEAVNFLACLETVANGRSSDAYPLHNLYQTLKKRAERIDPTCLFAKRLKRMPSIVAKVRRFESMKLSAMQDLGGCRAVLTSPTSIKLMRKWPHI